MKAEVGARASTNQGQKPGGLLVIGVRGGAGGELEATSLEDQGPSSGPACNLLRSG